MSVKRGQDWGQSGPLPADGVVVHSNTELRKLVEDCRRSNQDLPTVGLAGGDLWRTLGGSKQQSRLATAEAQHLKIDVGSVLVDGKIYWFVAHAVARKNWWSGPIWVAANAAHHGKWNLAPRAHPGDGLLDIISGNLPFGQRLKARSRLATGTHLPHPGLKVRRTSAAQTTLAPGTSLWLDGHRVGEARDLSVRLEPEALHVVI
jgi:diacylglycerol kinase family enzyme